MVSGDIDKVVQLNEESGRFQSRGTFVHPYPTTKIMFCPVRQRGTP